MLQRVSPTEREPQLPESIAQALIATAECEAVVKHHEAGGRVVQAVSRVEETLEDWQGAFSALYRVGEGYIIAEGTGESYSEFIAIERSHVPEYLATIFDGEDQEIILTAETDPGWIDELW